MLNTPEPIIDKQPNGLNPSIQTQTLQNHMFGLVPAGLGLGVGPIRLGLPAHRRRRQVLPSRPPAAPTAALC